MAGRRLPRINEQMKREITQILRDEVRDPRIGFVTVTRAEAAPDLSFARVFVTVMGEDAAREESLAGLSAAAPFIRGELSKRLHIRRSPELRFEFDHSLKQLQRIEELLREARGDGAPATDPDEG